MDIALLNMTEGMSRELMVWLEYHHPEIFEEGVKALLESEEMTERLNNPKGGRDIKITCRCCGSIQWRRGGEIPTEEYDEIEAALCSACPTEHGWR